MPLDANDITNLERGIDAALDAVIALVQPTIFKIVQDKGRDAAGPLIGMVEAINENRAALANKCLIDAIAQHPDADESITDVETEGTVQ